jgi:hypothetical protein
VGRAWRFEEKGGRGKLKKYDAKYFGIENLNLKTGEDNSVFIAVLQLARVS